MKELAAAYYSHFFFGSHAGRLRLSLSSKAPEPLKLLVRDVCGDTPSQQCLRRLYVSLCALAEQDARVDTAEVPREMVIRVSRKLRDVDAGRRIGNA